MANHLSFHEKRAGAKKLVDKRSVKREFKVAVAKMKNGELLVDLTFTSRSRLAIVSSAEMLIAEDEKDAIETIKNYAASIFDRGEVR